MLNNYSSTSITPASIKAIISIANTQFGNGFITELELLNHIKSSNKYGIISKINNETSGFVLATICHDFNDLEPIIVSNYKWFEENFKAKFPLTVIETIGIHPNFTGKGIGKRLITDILNKTNPLSKHTMSLVWKHHNGTPLSHILEQCGLSHQVSFTDYWKKDSLQNNYDCKYCGHPPCECIAMVYAD